MHTLPNPDERRACLKLLTAVPGAYAVGQWEPWLRALEARPTMPHPPAATVIALDLSRSMGFDNRMARAKAVALALVQGLTAQHRRNVVAIVGIEEYAYHLTPAAVPRATWHRGWVGTNMHHALQLAQALLHPYPQHRRQVLVLTDGEPTAHLEDDGTAYFNYPPTRRTLERTFQEVEYCAQARIRLHPFLFDTDPWATRLADMMADRTHGRVFDVAPQQSVEVTLAAFIHAYTHA